MPGEPSVTAMLRTFAAATLLAALLAGCSGDGPGSSTGQGSGLELGVITPGVWNVTGQVEHLMVWAHNERDEPVELTWSMTLAGGEPLPAGWNVTFVPSSLNLQADGTRTQTPRGDQYPAWGHALATLVVPADAAAGPMRVRLHAGDASTEVELQVASELGRVGGPGARVEVAYTGTFRSSGEEFDSGSFPTQLGSGQTVPGFDNGLMGLAQGERARIEIPPAFAYGYHNPQGSGYEQFNGETLVFDVRILRLG
jgi:hypothetical protein